MLDVSIALLDDRNKEQTEKRDFKEIATHICFSILDAAGKNPWVVYKAVKEKKPCK